MAEVEIFKLFLLVMIRVGGLVVSAPVLGSGNFPIMGKIGLTAATALLITPTLPALAAGLPAEPMAFGVLAIGELMIGLMMGFVMTLVFAAVQVAGQIMDLQTGFGMMNVFNPAMETQYPIFGFFLFILGVLFLLVTGGHRMMLWALYSTYEHIPVGGFTVHPELWVEAGRWGQWLFIDGLMLAAPVTAAMLLAYVVLGLLGRVVPQIQLF
nr:flagellar biosynthetic protein FliR [Candidatus Hydrogenedentota bacterium]